MQIDDETRRVLETRGHVQAVCPGQASEVKPPRLTGPGTPYATPGKAPRHTKSRQRQMTTTSQSQARRFHWRYWTATTTGALSYSETFTNWSATGKRARYAADRLWAAHQRPCRRWQSAMSSGSVPA